MRILNYAKICLLCVLAVGLTACEEDQEMVDAALIERSWTGYVGMRDDYGEQVHSSFFFGADGLGEEIQFYDDGERYGRFPFRWRWEDSYNRNLMLEYAGNVGISYMDNIRIRGTQMWGVFYFSRKSAGFNFTLEMDY